MGKRTRLDIYDEYPSDAIDEAINQWIHDRQQREILHYKLVDGMTYEEIADLLTKQTGQFISEKTVQRKVYKAESKLFPRLQIVYHRPL